MTRRLLSRIKAYQARGSGYIQIFLSFGIITANIALFKEEIALWGFSVEQAIIISAIIYFGFTVMVGYIDAKHGVWGEELAVSSRLNPVINGMSKKVEEIHNELMDKKV